MIRKKRAERIEEGKGEGRGIMIRWEAKRTERRNGEEEVGVGEITLGVLVRKVQIIRPRGRRLPGTIIEKGGTKEESRDEEKGGKERGKFKRKKREKKTERGDRWMGWIDRLTDI